MLAYLRGLQTKHEFVILDLSELRTVDGDPDAYYDGFHMKKSNARRVLETVVAQAPAAFE